MPGVGVSAGGNLVGIGFPGREVAPGGELPPQDPSPIAAAQAARHRVAAPALGCAERLSTQSAPDWEDLTNQPPSLPASPIVCKRQQSMPSACGRGFFNRAEPCTYASSTPRAISTFVAQLPPASRDRAGDERE